MPRNFGKKQIARFNKEYAKEDREHPELPTWVKRKIAGDHIRRRR